MTVDPRTLNYGIPDDRERDELARVLAHAFGFEIEAEHGWFREAGFDNLRVVRGRGGVRAGFAFIPMGQFFGGRAVPMVGFAAVGVRADELRRGTATAMMRRALLELYERRVAIASLYASTWSLYRKVGFECAGTRSFAQFAPSAVAIADHGCSVSIATEADRPAVEALYRELASEHDGYLDRGPYIWRRIYDTRFGIAAHGILVHDERGLAGYLYYRKHKLAEGFRHRVEVTDVMARNVAALRRIWTFFADLATMVDRIDLPTAPHDSVFLAHPDPRFRMQLLENWMIRIVDVTAALQARGFAPNVHARLDLEIDDRDLPQNAGRVRVHVQSGRAHVERGGDGSVRVDARGLAALYSGFVGPAALRRLGRLDASDDALPALAATFASAGPWMREMF